MIIMIQFLSVVWFTAKKLQKSTLRSIPPKGHQF